MFFMGLEKKLSFGKKIVAGALSALLFAGCATYSGKQDIYNAEGISSSQSYSSSPDEKTKEPSKEPVGDVSKDSGNVSGTPYTNKELIWWGISALAMAADTYSTKLRLETGGVEMNPIYGKHPSVGTLIASNAIELFSVYVLGQVFPKYRKQISQVSAASHLLGASVNFGKLASIKYYIAQSKK